MKRQFRAAAGLALLAVLSCAASASAQDPARVAPRMYKVRLNTPRVRVLEVTGKAGQKARMHVHPDYVTYAFGDARTRFTYPKGKPVEVTSKAGQVTWHAAETHAGQVTGKNEAHVLIVELK